jgi:AcrR family transcriptional regulator
MKNVKRKTKSTLRQRQAEATRRMIVEAARSLFLEHGYGGTTIEAIAERAGVAVSTVYAAFGSKREILRAIRLAWHARSLIRQATYGSPGTAGPEERLEKLARATYRQWETGSEVVAIYNGAAAADPEAAAELSEALKGRRKGMETFAASLQPYLKEGINAAQAAAILQALCLPEVFDELVRKAGWSQKEYEGWLAGALKRELLGKNRGPGTEDGEGGSTARGG